MMLLMTKSQKANLTPHYSILRPLLNHSLFFLSPSTFSAVSSPPVFRCSCQQPKNQPDITPVPASLSIFSLYLTFFYVFTSVMLRLLSLFALLSLLALFLLSLLPCFLQFSTQSPWTNGQTTVIWYS